MVPIPGVKMKVKTEPIWSLLLGLKQGWNTCALVIILLVYNFAQARAHLLCEPAPRRRRTLRPFAWRTAYVIWMYHVAHRICCTLAAVALVAGFSSFTKGFQPRC